MEQRKQDQEPPKPPPISSNPSTSHKIALNVQVFIEFILKFIFAKLLIVEDACNKKAQNRT